MPVSPVNYASFNTKTTYQCDRNDTVINLWHERVNISAEERDFLLSEIPEITADNLDIVDDLVFRLT
jgi:predicted secreted protein